MSLAQLGKHAMAPKSHDVRLLIPAFAWLNHQIVDLAEQRNDTRRSIEEVFSSPPYANQGLDAMSYKLLNPAHIVSLLYCLIVVPKELLDYPADHFLFKRLDKSNVAKAFRISRFPMGFDQSPSYWLLRALRNSVAHVLYEFESSEVHFWTDQSPIWDARASLDELSIFFSTFSRELVNTLLRLRQET
jgi:hypothetical protein